MSPAARLLGWLARYRRAFVAGFACVVAATSLSLAGPWVLKLAVDDLHHGVTADKVRLYAALLLALAAAGGVFRFLMRRIIVGASRDIEYDLRTHLFARLQQQDAAYFRAHRTGDLMSRATHDLNAVRMMVGPAVMYTASTGLTFVVALALMVSIHPWLTIIAVLPLPFVSLAVRYFGRETHDRFERIQAQLSTMSAVTQESLAGVRVVRAYRQEPFEIARFRAASEEYLRRNRALVVLQAFYFPSMGFLMGLGALLVLWLGSRETIAGRLTIGELVAFNGYLMMLAWPMIAFGWVTNLLQRGMASWRRMLEVIDVEPSITDADAGGWQGREIRGDIEFRALTVGYGGRVVLRDVSARLPAGTVTAIVGATGSGKSTLLHVLPRLHEAPAGTVFIDGTDVRRIPLAVLRGAIGMVTQEPFLFSASLAENIALGTRGNQGTRERVRAAAQVAGLEPDLAALPEGLDTVIGERGITLSGGQKQRVAMARALVPDPPILILDDALSAVDTETEERILQGLRGVMAGRTTILVSHRVSTVRHADRILVLDAGRIVEQGTHDELVGRGGVYADLHRRQLLEDELEVS